MEQPIGTMRNTGNILQQRVARFDITPTMIQNDLTTIRLVDGGDEMQGG